MAGLLWVFYPGKRQNRIVGSSGGRNSVLSVPHDPLEFGHVKGGQTVGAHSMGPNSATIPICPDHVSHCVHLDDGIDGLY